MISILYAVTVAVMVVLYHSMMSATSGGTTLNGLDTTLCFAIKTICG